MTRRISLACSFALTMIVSLAALAAATNAGWLSDDPAGDRKWLASRIQSEQAGPSKPNVIVEYVYEHGPPATPPSVASADPPPAPEAEDVDAHTIERPAAPVEAGGLVTAVPESRHETSAWEAEAPAPSSAQVAPATTQAVVNVPSATAQVVPQKVPTRYQPVPMVQTVPAVQPMLVFQPVPVASPVQPTGPTTTTTIRRTENEPGSTTTTTTRRRDD